MSRVVHFEIHADDLTRAARFYTDLFGWTISKWDGPVEYWMIFTGPEGTPGINGGLIPRMHPRGEADAVIAFVCTVNVDNLDTSLARALEVGATVAMPKMPVPGVGYLAYLKDTEGNVFGMMQSDRTVTG